MSPRIVGLLYRGIIQHLSGDAKKSKEYIKRAGAARKYACECGGQTVYCKYGRRPARICLDCGVILQDGHVVKQCVVNSERAG